MIKGHDSKLMGAHRDAAGGSFRPTRGRSAPAREQIQTGAEDTSEAQQSQSVPSEKLDPDARMPGSGIPNSFRGI